MSVTPHVAARSGTFGESATPTALPPGMTHVTGQKANAQISRAPSNLHTNTMQHAAALRLSAYVTPSRTGELHGARCSLTETGRRTQRCARVHLFAGRELLRFRVFGLDTLCDTSPDVGASPAKQEQLGRALLVGGCDGCVEPSPLQYAISVADVRRIAWSAVDVDWRAHGVRAIVAPLVHL